MVVMAAGWLSCCWVGGQLLAGCSGRGSSSTINHYHSALYQAAYYVLPAPQAQAYERRLFTADQEAPPSLLHPGGTLLQVRARVRCGFCWKVPPGWQMCGCV